MVLNKSVYQGDRLYTQHRFQDYIRREDRRLVLPWFGSLGLQFFNYSMYDIYESPARQLEIALTLQDIFQADFVNIFDDGIIISETLGLPLLKPDHDFPSVAEHLIKRPEDLALFSVPDPHQEGRMPVNLESMKRLAETSPKPVAINVEGPFTLAGQVMGVPDLARNIIKNKKFVNELMAFTTEAVGRYARALMEAGADLVSLAEPTSIILSPRQFESLVLPALKSIYSGLDCWKALHICGDTSHILDLMIETGVDGLSLDQIMNLPELLPRIPDEMVLFGNIDPIEIMLEANPETVAAKTRNLLSAMKDNPYFVMSTGCDLVMDTPRENMMAFMETGRTPADKWEETALVTPVHPVHPHPKTKTESRPAASRAGGDALSDSIYERIQVCVETFDLETCLAACREAVETGLDPRLIIDRGLAAGMIRAGRLFDEQIYFVPELLMASEVLHAGLDLLAPCLKAAPQQSLGKIVLGVVEGDIHEIGKDLVATMFKAGGWEVIDLGANVPLDDFIKACDNHQPDIVGLSALMSTTMRVMPDFIKTLKSRFPGILFLIGGAPLGHHHVETYGADGYGRDALEAVNVAESLVERRE